MTRRFITFEGIDGAGKSTHVAPLAERLRARGQHVVCTREPGGTPLAEALRELLLHEPMDGVAETLLVFAARRDHIERVIAPALERGETVLCDRFSDATFAYQGAGRGLDPTMLAEWNRAATGGLVPDLTLLFDVPPQLGLARRGSAAGEPNRLDLESEAFHTRVRECYLELARGEPERFVVLDAAQSPEALEARVWAAVSARLPAEPARG